MKYIEVTITLSPIDPFRDLLVDALGNEGPYDSFVETPEGLKAYVPADLFDAGWLQKQINDLQKSSIFNSQFSIQEMPDKNWNEEWERQHQPVLVEAENGKRIWVRAPFHEHRNDVDYEIEIEPKMSFGTAHHATTYMMLSYLAELPLEGRRVLDMGCGTAVLGILAKMRGANYVEGIDVDEWAFNNALENVQRNAVEMTIRSNRLLRNMVRSVPGTLLDVGRGKLTLEGLRQIVERKDRCAAGVSMPAQGLFLTKVEYPWEELRIEN